MSSMFEPRKTKFRKYHKGSKGRVLGQAAVREFSSAQSGDAVICINSNARLASAHFVVVRAICSKRIKALKKGHFKIVPFPHLNITKKAAETRMGGGKGAPDHYVSVLQKGSVLVEFFGVPSEAIQDIYHQLDCKLPAKLQLITLVGDDSNE